MIKKSLIVLMMFLLFIGNVMAEKVTLTWDPNSESDLAGYNIYRSNTQGGPYIKIGNNIVPNILFTDEEVPYGTNYWVVTAYNTSNVESGYSNEVSKTIEPPAPPPGVPSGLKRIEE